MIGDPFDRFVHARVARRQDANVPVVAMFEAYRAFCRQIGRPALVDRQEFTRRMFQRGYAMACGAGIVWTDVELRPALELVRA